MKRYWCLGVAAALGFAAWAGPASAQSYWFDLGVNGGFSLHTPMVDDGVGNVTGATKFGTGWLVGGQLTIWPWDRVGLRANFNYADRTLEADDEIWPSNNLYSGSGDLVFRFRAPNETWQGAETLPFLALGAGIKWINPSGDDFICYDTSRNEFWSCVPFNQGGGATAAVGEWKESWMGLIGIGADFRFSPRWLARVELNDRIYKPQVQNVAGFLGGNVWAVPDGESNEAKLVHEISASVGLSIAFGMKGPAMVATAPPPPPPTPTPTPTPEPPPPPREDAISVCVIDPTTTQGIRMQQAMFVHASGDTVVVTAGQRVPLRQSVGTLTTAENADWYVRGAPFVVPMTAQQRAEFATYGGPTRLQPADVVFLGTVSGMGVYVGTNEAQALRAPLQAAQGADLAAKLAASQALRTAFDEVRVVYVPLRAIGCAFQPLQRQEEVRKTGN